MPPLLNFPRWLYHHSESPRIVHSQEELELLGDEWKTSPADVITPAAAPAPAETSNAAREEKPARTGKRNK